MTRILITGVRGRTAAPLARTLADRPGIEVLGGSSDPASVTAEGVRPTAFSWDAPAGWPAAADGVDAVYVVRPDREDAPELVTRLLTAVPAQTRVVLLSERSPEAHAPGGWALATEQAVRDAGRPWTLLRPGWFMQVLTDERFFRDRVLAGELPFPAAGARLAWIDARDIAAVAERALLEDGHDGRAYEITGPEALTLPETAETLAEGLGRPVAHVEEPEAEALHGFEGFDRDLFALTIRRVHAGVFADVTDVVERVTGRPARTLRAFAADARHELGFG